MPEQIFFWGGGEAYRFSLISISIIYNTALILGSLAMKQPIAPMIGFHVALDHDQSTRGKVAFNRVLSNYGNGWNSITHTFKVPVKGLYFLTLTIMNRGNPASASLKRGSTVLQIAFAADGNGNSGTQSTVLILAAGEHIYAQLRGGTLLSNYSLTTYLAGFLIQKTV